MIVKLKTKQEAFDTIARHLLTQKKRASIALPGAPLFGTADCQYRVEKPGRHPLRCAIGCLIPKSKYDPYLEGNNITDDVVSELLDQLGYSTIQAVFFAEIQELHDRTPPAEWRAELRIFAKKYELQDYIIDEVL